MARTLHPSLCTPLCAVLCTLHLHPCTHTEHITLHPTLCTSPCIPPLHPTLHPAPPHSAACPAPCAPTPAPHTPPDPSSTAQPPPFTFHSVHPSLCAPQQHSPHCVVLWDPHTPHPSAAFQGPARLGHPRYVTAPHTVHINLAEIPILCCRRLSIPPGPPGTPHAGVGNCSLPHRTKTTSVQHGSGAAVRA